MENQGDRNGPDRQQARRDKKLITVLVVKKKRKRPVARPRHRCNVSINMHIRCNEGGIFFELHYPAHYMKYKIFRILINQSMKHISHSNAIGFVFYHQNTHHSTYIFKMLFISLP